MYSIYGKWEWYGRGYIWKILQIQSLIDNQFALTSNINQHKISYNDNEKQIHILTSYHFSVLFKGKILNSRSKPENVICEPRSFLFIIVYFILLIIRNLAIFPLKIHWTCRNGGWSKYSFSLSMLGFDVLYGIPY
jgi:hypothetical protein